MRHKFRTEELLQLAKGSRAPVSVPGWKTPEFSETCWEVTAQFSSDEHTTHREDRGALDPGQFCWMNCSNPGNVQQGGAWAPWDVLIHGPAWECCTWLKGLESGTLHALANPNPLTATVPLLDFPLARPAFPQPCLLLEKKGVGKPGLQQGSNPSHHLPFLVCWRHPIPTGTATASPGTAPWIPKNHGNPEFWEFCTGKRQAGMTDEMVKETSNYLYELVVSG